VWLVWVYDAITNLPAERERAATAHGLAALRLERGLHLDPELTLNHWIVHHHVLGLLAGDYYDNVHFLVTFALFAWLWWRHPRQYRPLRTTLVLVNVIGFTVFWLYPMAPPRLLPGQHFYDIAALTHAFGSAQSGALSKAANQFAAMPSLHLAWATWSALAVWMVCRRRRWAPLVWLYPACTAVVVMATGNHFLADCVLGVATTAVSALVAFGINRVTTRAWPGTGRPPGRAHPAPVPAPDQS
jgi:PAP2 superfamily